MVYVSQPRLLRSRTCACSAYHRTIRKSGRRAARRRLRLSARRNGVLCGLRKLRVSVGERERQVLWLRARRVSVLGAGDVVLHEGTLRSFRELLDDGLRAAYEHG